MNNSRGSSFRVCNVCGAIPEGAAKHEQQIDQRSFQHLRQKFRPPSHPQDKNRHVGESITNLESIGRSCRNSGVRGRKTEAGWQGWSLDDDRRRKFWWTFRTTSLSCSTPPHDAVLTNAYHTGLKLQTLRRGRPQCVKFWNSFTNNLYLTRNLVVLLKSGPSAGKIAVIAEIIDHKRVRFLISLARHNTHSILGNR